MPWKIEIPLSRFHSCSCSETVNCLHILMAPTFIAAPLCHVCSRSVYFAEKTQLGDNVCFLFRPLLVPESDQVPCADLSQGMLQMYVLQQDARRRSTGGQRRSSKSHPFILSPLPSSDQCSIQLTRRRMVQPYCKVSSGSSASRSTRY